MSDLVDLPLYTCQKCKHRWLARTTNPKQCPKCKSNHWNMTKDRYTKTELESAGMFIEAAARQSGTTYDLPSQPDVILIDQNSAYNPVGTGHEWTTVRKKPVMVQAVQMEQIFQVETLEGMMTGQVGDFLIRGIKGELYPCKRDIFLASYENV